MSLEAYRGQLPELSEWWARIRQKIYQDRTLTTPLGRRRVF